jgi:hypothetical protein
MDNTKICKKCLIEKELNKENFKIERRVRLGFESVCRKCRREEGRVHRLNNIETYKKREKKARESKRNKEYHKEYYNNHKEEFQEYQRQRYYDNPEPYLIRSKEQKIRLGDKYKEYQKEYRKNNKEYLNKKALENYHKNTNRRIKNIISGSIRKRLNGKTKKSHTTEYLGCSIEFFREYISKKFKDGMEWENYGQIWNLDHIIPCRAFDLNNEEEIFKCFHYTNYQPLFCKENFSKQDEMPDGKFARHIFPR